MQAAETAPPAAARPPGRARRSYVIDRGFQLKYTLLLVTLGAAASALFGTMMYLAHVDVLRDVALPPEVRLQLAAADTTLLFLVAAITFLMAGALALIGVLITHRVAGPVHVMSHYVSVLSRGRFPQMRPLRKSDELKDFFERFQQAVEAMRTRDAEDADAIERAVARLRSGASGDDGAAAIEVLEGIARRKRDATDRVDVGRQGGQ